MSLVGWILGRRLGNEEQPEREIGAFEGVPAMGLDGLGSSAYGPEAALTILIPLGAAGLVYIGPIMAAIIALLVILYLSYRQTIAAYPNNGGAYIVSRENLGRNEPARRGRPDGRLCAERRGALMRDKEQAGLFFYLGADRRSRLL
jgi:hypothetical protein